METFESWILPFTFIPGVAMLILSTSNRFYHVKELIRGKLIDDAKMTPWSLDDLMGRARLLHRALVLQYVSIGSFALSALTANLHHNWLRQENAVVSVVTDALILAGVFCLVLSSAVLIREATKSLRDVEHMRGTD